MAEEINLFSSVDSLLDVVHIIRSDEHVVKVHP